jgi:5-formyltetrahydrofolate cyclo-ligase
LGQHKRVAHAGKISGVNDIALAKAQLRSKILASRVRRESSNQALTANLLELVSQLDAQSVATYLSFGTEPATTDFIDSLLDDGIEVLVPKALPDETLAWFKWDGVSEITSSLGIKEPDENKLLAVSVEQAELLLIPALAVDRMGNRLGRGKGYFDRELSVLSGSKVYAVCFEDEVMESIPSEAHDQRVSGVVTEVAIHELN